MKVFFYNICCFVMFVTAVCILSLLSYLYFSTQGVPLYHMTSSLESKGSCIDNNHSHFILVDNGTEGKYGGEIEWRANLQNCIAAEKIPRSKYGIDALYCSNLQEAMWRKKHTIAWPSPVFICR